jgi:tetratricopeptide (TPR) repeat protein
LGHRGIALLFMRDFGQTLACFERNLALAPERIDTLAWKGSCVYMLGRFQEAVSRLNVTAHNCCISMTPAGSSTTTHLCMKGI